MDLGICKDCDKEIDFIVTRDQVLGTNVFVCPECKADRIIDAAKEKAGGVLSDAKAARAEARQETMLKDGRDGVVLKEAD